MKATMESLVAPMISLRRMLLHELHVKGGMSWPR